MQIIDLTNYKNMGIFEFEVPLSTEPKKVIPDNMVHIFFLDPL